ncbi:MAG TPA: type IV pilin protein [Fluviicoccus sp.]|nr:type IV pilin protein [Fluviicoccus sp.]
MNKNKGFTIVEMMVVVVIIAILAGIAIPQYQAYVTRGNRGGMQADLMQIAALMERYKSQNLSYKNASLTTLYGGTRYPKNTNQAARYNLTLTVDANGIVWSVLAAPTGKQAGDGAMELWSDGRRCWNKTSDAGCDENSTSQGWSTK